jgi:hypothetical protein
LFDQLVALKLKQVVNQLLPFILCSSFVFNLLLKAGESLHFVKPPMSANAWLGVKANNTAKVKLLN